MLDNIVHYADPHIRITMLSRLDLHLNDPLRQAEELVRYVQSTEIDNNAKNLGRDVVNVIEPRKVLQDKAMTRVKATSLELDECTCYMCSEVGHIRPKCLQSKKKVPRHPSSLILATVEVF